MSALKINGVQCGSPSLKNKKFCFFHEKSRQRRLAMSARAVNRHGWWRLKLELPLLEDANSIQVALMQVMRLLMTKRIEHKEASLLLYALQTASSNLRNTSFEPSPQQVVIDRCGVPETSLGDQAWYKEEFEEEKEDEEAVDIKACADPACHETSVRQNKRSNNKSSYEKSLHHTRSYNRDSYSGSYRSGSYQGTPFRRAEKAVMKKPALATRAMRSKAAGPVWLAGM